MTGNVESSHWKASHMRTIYSLVYRSIVLGLIALMCAFLASKFGVWTATGCAAAVLLAVCGSIGAGMRFQPQGRVTLVRQSFTHGPGDSGLRSGVREQPERAAEVIQGRLDQLSANMRKTLLSMQETLS